jgi:Flp pilus assembly protein TadB
MPRARRQYVRRLLSRRYARRLSRSGAGWTFGEIIMIAIAFAAIVAAVAIIIYEVEVYLPEHQGVDQNATAPAIIHQTHPPL